MLADRPDPLVLHVQRRRHAANLEGGAAGDPAAEIAPPRGRRELPSEQRVHGSGGSQHQQIEVFPQVGIMLPCLRKQELDSVRHADPVDPPHEGEGVPDPLVVQGTTHGVAFNLADVFAFSGDVLLLSAVVLQGLRQRTRLRDTI